MKKTEEIFKVDALFDAKHKINCSPAKEIPESTIKEAESQGLTIETLDRLSENGLDIFKYKTQITIHGICNCDTSGYVDFYKSMVINKNKSLGIRWRAVDVQKKNRIISGLRRFGWWYVDNSAELRPQLSYRCFSQKQISEKCEELKKISQRINRSLFFGKIEINIYEGYGCFYPTLDLYVDGIYDINVKPLILSVLGLSEAEYDKEIKEQDKQAESERKEMELHDLERQKRLHQKMTETAKKVEGMGYKKTEIKDISVDGVFVIVRNFGKAEGAYKTKSGKVYEYDIENEKKIRKETYIGKSDFVYSK